MFPSSWATQRAQGLHYEMILGYLPIVWISKNLNLALSGHTKQVIDVTKAGISVFSM